METSLQMNILATNKKAYYDYEILQKHESGVVLSGTEVKSAKMGQMSLKGSFISVQKKHKNPEFFLSQTYISPYKMAAIGQNHSALRERKLLLKRHEISLLVKKIQEKGLTLIPLRVYTKANRIKVEIALARGKKKYEKREVMKKREGDRKIRQAMRISMM